MSSEDYCPDVGKSSWPELVGVAGDVAVATIEKENPSVNAVIITPETVWIPAIFCDRVLVFVDANGIVNSVPTVG
ncbi:inhibitor of trypsin and hageman factor-like [Salvia miltiorrhiza]|uniref:inhibitor of trypsin and hageman factor-like n=1 Tax=Salvia miltiorrhiza TaxID=226208 RepID=UPI0025AC80D4|nr:inhibitor of trypsin and hageman factor-like [Salvia miltiorrhiza]